MAETLHITTSGEGAPLVLLHGWGLNSGVWQPTVRALEKSFQVITVDLPGFGVNHSYACDDYSIENIAMLIEQAVTAVVSEPAVYIGWSLGGLVATKIALMSPQKVKKLVNICSSPYFVSEENWYGIQPEVLTAFHQQLAQDSHKTINGFLKIQAMGSPHIRQDVKQIKQLITQYEFPTIETLDAALLLLENVDLRSELSYLSVPSLRIYGRLDTLVPNKGIALISALESKDAPNESFIFEQSSHAPFISEPEFFIEKLSNWLKAI